MVTVTTPAGPQPVDGTDWVTADGILTVVDDDGVDVATFAAGDWTSVTVEVAAP